MIRIAEAGPTTAVTFLLRASTGIDVCRLGEWLELGDAFYCGDPAAA